MDHLVGARSDITMQFQLLWEQIKAPLVVPLLRIAVLVCSIMSLMLFIERVYMGIVILLVKLFGRKPEKRYKWEPIKDDVELGNSAYPMVLVQIPMYNEREVHFLFFIYIANVDVELYKHKHYWLYNAGVSTLDWSCVWTLLAVWSHHNSSPWRFNWPNNQSTWNPSFILSRKLKMDRHCFILCTGFSGAWMPKMGKQRD